MNFLLGLNCMGKKMRASKCGKKVGDTRPAHLAGMVGSTGLALLSKID